METKVRVIKETRRRRKRVKIVQLDGIIMNLALSKIARYHHDKGDAVSFDEPNPDLIYYGAIFDWTAKRFKNQRSLGGKQIFGGYPFNDSQLSPEMDACVPYYDLWGVDYSLGYSSRGCIRKCPFCIVPKKEGAIRDYQPIAHWHDPRHKKVILLDNNFFASPKWRYNLAYLNDNGLRVSFNQGLDLRLITEEIAKLLKDTKSEGHDFTGRHYYFAWDNIKEEKAIKKGLQRLLDAEISKNALSVYVLAGFDSTFEEDLYRCEVLWNEYGIHPFVMKFNKRQVDKRLNALTRWANRPAAHRNHSWKEYVKWRGVTDEGA